MRKPTYLSPTSIMQWIKDRDEFIKSRLADNRPPRLPQTQPMSIGSAFDAYVKNYLITQLRGKTPKEFELKTIIEAQVEPHNRAWAIVHGKHAFESYKYSGALADLIMELRQADGEVQFEFTVENRVAHESCVGGVPLLGKPDTFFRTLQGAHAVLDYKVNGYCSASNTSPAKGYMLIRDGWGSDVAPPSRGANCMHKDCQPMMHDGLVINIGHQFEDVNLDFAIQLCIYAWVLGEPVGSDFVIGIEQLVCKGNPKSGYPLIRVATHRGMVSKQFQFDLYKQIHEIWYAINNDHIFEQISKQESQDRVGALIESNEAFKPDSDDPREKWFIDKFRQHSF